MPLEVVMGRNRGSGYFDIFFDFVGPHGRRLVVEDSMRIEQID